MSPRRSLYSATHLCYKHTLSSPQYFHNSGIASVHCSPLFPAMADSPTVSGSSYHRQRASLGTRASGIADSTISFNTYATGITDGSLCLSQFPPPPVDLPITPISDRFFPSPAQSTFTIAPPQFVAPGTERGFHSPAQSTFTIASRPSVGPVCPRPALLVSGSPQIRHFPLLRRVPLPSLRRHLRHPAGS